MFKRVLAPLDGSRFATKSLTSVAALCRAFGAELVIAIVWDDRQRETMTLELPGKSASPSRSSDDEDMMRRIKSYIRNVARVVGDTGVSVTPLALQGDACDQIIEATRESGCDLVAMAPHTHEQTRRQLLGSVTEQVLHRSPVPVLIMRPGEAGLFAGSTQPPGDRVTLLVPLDGSEASETSLPTATSLAVALGAGLLLIVVAPPPLEEGSAAGALEEASVRGDAEAYLGRLSGDLRGKGLTVDYEVRFGDPAREVILRADREPGTAIVMSTRRRSSSSSRLIASVADRVIQHARATVLVVPRDAAPARDTASS